MSESPMLHVTYSPALQQRLMAALTAMGPGYQPRTKHLQEDGSPEYTNRLILEDSPYLQQHAHNPVDWYSWGQEAFEKAKRENKPIFLSIGYSTCHWCHVMEESFDDPEIAALLNKYFVAIKVDRERNPDVDKTYMTAVMLLNKSGGWPMSSFLTPEGKTFFGGTYFPQPQFAQLLNRVHEVWGQQEEGLREQADEVARMVEQITAGEGAASKLGETVIQQAVTAILSGHDKLKGGFSPAPKFPHESELFLLLERAEREDDKEALAAVETSLKAMAQGGIYDQVGGGFHRYATDDNWLIPHFEKMLYNQAHLARAYLLAWRLTADPLYERVVRETLDYVLRDMTSPEGGFYSATDADSEGEEGLFFLWSKPQLQQALTLQDAKLAIDLFGVTDRGNFEDSNILNLPVALDRYARQKKQPLPELLKSLDRIRERLRVVREQRIHPLRDDKVITAWNGMMITTMAMAGDQLSEPRYLDAATKAAAFIWDHNHSKKERLLRVHLNGSSSVPAVQNDHAYYAESLIHLFDITENDVWLERAKEIANDMLSKFWDQQHGGFFMSSADDELSTMGRPKDSDDNAIPSGNAVALRVLAMLAKRANVLEYGIKANATLVAFAGLINRRPMGYAYMLMAADELLKGELGAHQYAGRGVVEATAQVAADADGKEWLKVELKMAPGWHINAHKPLQDYLIPTTLELSKSASNWQLSTVTYPTPETKNLGFQREPLALYENAITLQAELTYQGDEHSKMGLIALPVRLSLQACDDRICLSPETLKLGLPLPELKPDAWTKLSDSSLLE